MKNLHLLLWCLGATVPAFGQTHAIDNDTLYISGSASDNNVAVNTYYNAITEAEVDWNVLDVQIPDGWEFSFCFPNCYPIGVTQSTSAFPANSQQYLNCHVYPNGVPGSGTIQMLIETNELYQDTVTWLATFEEVSNIGLIRHASHGIETQQSANGLSICDLPPGAEVLLYDSQGALLMSFVAKNGCGTFSLGHMSGFHIVTVESESKIIFRQKFVFQ